MGPSGSGTLPGSRGASRTASSPGVGSPVGGRGPARAGLTLSTPAGPRRAPAAASTRTCGASGGEGLRAPLGGPGAALEARSQRSSKRLCLALYRLELIPEGRGRGPGTLRPPLPRPGCLETGRGSWECPSPFWGSQVREEGEAGLQGGGLSLTGRPPVTTCTT